MSYEIPWGKVNKKESPMTAARRECLEETGFFCKKLKLLIAYDPDLENTINQSYYYHKKKMKIFKHLK